MFKKRYRGAGTVRWMRSDGHSPYVGPNGNWWEWDDHVGDYVDSGIPARGPIGIQGCIVRVTEWAKGIQYRNDQTLSEEIRYIDVVLTINGPAKFDFYQCREMHISDDTNKPSETSRWWKKLDNTFPLYTPLIISPNAKIDLLTNNAIRLLNSNEVVVSYLSGDGENGIAFAAGVENFGTKDETQKAVIRHDGTSKFIGTEIEGKVTATSGTIGGFNIGANYIGTGANASGGANGMSLWEDAIIFNGADSRQAIVGPTSSLGYKFLARFSDTVVGQYEEWIDKTGIVINVNGSKSNNTAIQINGGHISGFAVRTRRISSSTTLTKQDVMISCYFTSDSYIYMPENPDVGDIKIVYNVNNKSISMRGNGHQFLAAGGGGKWTALSFNFGPGHDLAENYLFVWDGQYWIVMSM
jgi:hypothetical protein